MKIGNVTLGNNVFLAPMAGITDRPFRILCKEQGCGMVYTEMVSAKGMHYNDQKTQSLINMSEYEKPIGVQIFGSEPLLMAQIADRLNETQADIIDINMGCPTPKITKNGEGSALMLRPELVGQIIREVTRASVKPVTVKIRKGWDNQNINAVLIAKIAEQNGAAAITIHGRTRAEQYTGKADWNIIRDVKNAVTIPVIGNGDIRSPMDADSMLCSTGCDAIMIGRGAQGNPWLFSRILHYQKTREILPEASIPLKIQTANRHLHMLIEQKGEHIGINEMRKHVAWYIKGMKYATYFKERVFQAKSKLEVSMLLEELAATSSDHSDGS